MSLSKTSLFDQFLHPTLRLLRIIFPEIEKNELLIQKYPELPITLDAAQLITCNKVLGTSTIILNHSLDEILSHCVFVK